jgi:type I restriction enzyme R subunit
LIGVEWQSAKYTSGLPAAIPSFMTPLPFAYESTGVDTRFTNGLDPEPRSRRIFSFHRPETLAEFCSRYGEDPATTTLRQRLERRCVGPPTQQSKQDTVLWHGSVRSALEG